VALKPIDELTTAMQKSERDMIKDALATDRFKEMATTDKNLLKGDYAYLALKRKHYASDQKVPFETWLATNEGQEALDRVLTDQLDIQKGYNEEGARDIYFFDQLKDAGIYKYGDPVTPEYLAKLDERSALFSEEVDRAIISGLSVGEAFDSVWETQEPTIERSAAFAEQEAEKERIAAAPFQPRKSAAEALADATKRLERRIGGATLAQDIAEAKDALDLLERDLQAHQGVGGQEVYDNERAPGDPTYAERTQEMIDAKDAKAKEYTTIAAKQTERDNDAAVDDFMMKNPQLARAFASGNVDALTGSATDVFSRDQKLVDSGGLQSLIDHIVKKQETQGLVLSESQRNFRRQWGLPMPGAGFETAAEIAEQTRQTEIARARQASRATRYTAEGEVIPFDPDRATYDVAAMSRSGPLTALGTSFIPGTTLLDTMENRAALAADTVPQGGRQEVAPGVEVAPLPPQILGYYPEEEEEDEDEITPRSPHEAGGPPTPTPTEIARFTTRRLGK